VWSLASSAGRQLPSKPRRRSRVISTICRLQSSREPNLMAAAVVRGVNLIFLLSWTDEVQSNLPTLEQIIVLARARADVPRFARTKSVRAVRPSGDQV